MTFMIMKTAMCAEIQPTVETLKLRGDDLN